MRNSLDMLPCGGHVHEHPLVTREQTASPGMYLGGGHTQDHSLVSLGWPPALGRTLVGATYMTMRSLPSCSTLSMQQQEVWYLPGVTEASDTADGSSTMSRASSEPEHCHVSTRCSDSKTSKWRHPPLIIPFWWQQGRHGSSSRFPRGWGHQASPQASDH